MAWFENERSYFDAGVDIGGGDVAWANVNDAFDNDPATDADCVGMTLGEWSSVLKGTSNIPERGAPVRTVGRITSVHIGITASMGPVVGGFRMQPYFGGANNGDTHWMSYVLGVSYMAITNDTNAPSPWTWADIDALDIKIDCKASVTGCTWGRLGAIWLKVYYEPELYINIGDAWKNVIEIQVNVGDIWKTANDCPQLNVGDVWKDMDA